MTRGSKLCLFLLTLTFLTGGAFASTVTYNGGVFGLSLTPLSGTNEYSVTYTADFTNWTGGSLYISGINFAFGSDSPVAPSAAIPNPVSFISNTASGTWNIYAGPLTGGKLGTNGCQLNTSSNFICSQVNNSQYTLNPTSGTYTWVFDVYFTNPLQPSDLVASNDHIGALFLTSAGKSQGILSTGINIGTLPPVPEPGSLAFLGSGLIGAAAVLRKKLFS